MNKKYKDLYEFIELLDRDNSGVYFCKKHLKSIGYAPHMGYRTWIFKYKRALVAVFDAGNGHYDYFSGATYIDVLRATIDAFINRLSRLIHSII